MNNINECVSYLNDTLKNYMIEPCDFFDDDFEISIYQTFLDHGFDVGGDYFPIYHMNSNQIIEFANKLHDLLDFCKKE